MLLFLLRSDATSLDLQGVDLGSVNPREVSLPPLRSNLFLHGATGVSCDFLQWVLDSCNSLASASDLPVIDLGGRDLSGLQVPVNAPDNICINFSDTLNVSEELLSWVLYAENCHCIFYGGDLGVLNDMVFEEERLPGSFGEFLVDHRTRNIPGFLLGNFRWTLEFYDRPERDPAVAYGFPCEESFV